MLYAYRRKFRSQTSDNMDRWKKQRWEESEKRREEKKREEKRREEERSSKKESLRRKKIQVREKVRKSRNTVFPMICGSEGSKSRLAKAAGAEPAGQMRDEKSHAVVARSTFPSQNAQSPHVRTTFGSWDAKKCTPLWREAHLEVKMYKTHQLRSTFGSYDVEKVHAVVARSTFQSQNVQNTLAPDHFWKLWCRKSACRCGAKHISKSKCTKHTSSGPLLEVVQMSFRMAGARDCAPCQKWAKREGFVACPKTMASVGHLKKICKGAFSVAGAVQETCSSELLGGPGADFLRRVAFWSIGSSGLLWDDFAWQVQHFVWPGITFSWQAQYFRQVDWKNRKTHWHKAVTALHSTFTFEGSLAELLRFWCCQLRNLRKMRKSRRISSFLTLSSSKIWGSLAELLRFWCCQVQKLKKSRRIASFSSLQIDR